MTYWVMWLFHGKYIESILQGYDTGFTVMSLFHQAFLGRLILCNQHMSGSGLVTLKRVDKSLGGLVFDSYFLISSLGFSAKVHLYLQKEC